MNHTHLDATLTEPQALMLQCLREACDKTAGGKAAPRQLAKMRWPHSTAWERRTWPRGTNRNGAVGGTMPMKAATILWRLHDKRMAERIGYDYDPGANAWVITDFGREWLTEAGM